MPHDHWKATTPITPLNIAGVHCSIVVSVAVTADLVEALIEQAPAPELQPR